MSNTIPDVDVDVGTAAMANGVVDALYVLQNAEALYQCRLREQLHLGANELGAIQYIHRMESLGHDARAMDVTRSLGLSDGATSIIVSHLVARGFLTRTANPRDGRGKLLHLTDEATKMVSHHMDDAESDLSRLVSMLSFRDAKRVVEFLTAVTTSLNHIEPAHP